VINLTQWSLYINHYSEVERGRVLYWGERKGSVGEVKKERRRRRMYVVVDWNIGKRGIKGVYGGERQCEGEY
jgi:hypothetical protein